MICYCWVGLELWSVWRHDGASCWLFDAPMCTACWFNNYIQVFQCLFNHVIFVVTNFWCFLHICISVEHWLHSIFILHIHVHYQIYSSKLYGYCIAHRMAAWVWTSIMLYTKGKWNSSILTLILLTEYLCPCKWQIGIIGFLMSQPLILPSTLPENKVYWNEKCNFFVHTQRVFFLTYKIYWG